MHPIGLESQVIRELAQDDVVRAAAAAGFDHAGIWIDPQSWTDATTRDVRRAFAETGITPLEGEVIRLNGPLDDEQRRSIDIACEIGVRHMIVIALTDDRQAIVDGIAQLAERAAPGGVGIALEFGRFTSIATVADALATVRQAGPGVTILPDPIHLERAGQVAADLRRVPPELIAFAQICDAGPPPADMSRESLLDEARFHRRNLGEGTLNLAAYVAALPPGTPLSCEVRSLDLNRAIPDPFARAAALAVRMRQCLERWKEEA